MKALLLAAGLVDLGGDEPASTPQTPTQSSPRSAARS